MTRGARLGAAAVFSLTPKRPLRGVFPRRAHIKAPELQGAMLQVPDWSDDWLADSVSAITER